MRGRFAALFLILCWTSTAQAIDGVIEINQARAMVGNITPGDTAGFPITISQPGSYRLTSNLSGFDPELDVIRITASAVEIDLNGFNVEGQNEWAGGTSDCSGFGNGRGIFADGPYSGIVVKNGSVTGIGNTGIALLGSNGRVERVFVQESCGDGVRVGNASLVTDTIARRNFINGFMLGATTRISGSIATQNRNAGINNSSGGYLSVESCIASGNGHDGIIAGVRSTIQGNQVGNNTVNGIIADNGSSILDNVVNTHVGNHILGFSGGVGSGGNVVQHTAGFAFQGITHLYCDLDNSTKICTP